MRAVDEEPKRQRLYREVNLRIHEVTASLGHSERGVELLCECGRAGCEARFRAALEDSRTLLDDAQVLLLTPGHCDGHRVVAEHTTFVVVTGS